ncbi:hypothetical protein [Pseudomonas sp. EpS/L25]|uniref:hypothetical protein n=1 Tax=Pseudomonas sp. EpS/L25 TaxID=1749078 RepID=UPI000743D839|nr:hypothetical protein [Pseudomonas sp. EpS/L25]KUM45036.1 hypothetical protein AR540_01150 [Pseudomonas sp. EpS/L25]
MNTTNHPNDYLDAMQAAAFAFLQRHEGEHLGHSQQLFNRGVEYLLQMGVPQHTSERLVARAADQLEAVKGHRFLDIDASTGDVVVLVNPATGLRYRIPVQEIFDALIDEDPGTRQNASR